MTAYNLNEAKMFADNTDGIAIIINSETGIYYGMNAFATQLYENIAKGIAIEKISDKLKSFKDGKVDNFQDFVNVLIEKEIIISAEETEDEVELDENIAKNDKYFIELKEYSDAQELLLADPIHEVKEDEGWSPEKSSLNEDKEDVARREAKMEQ